MFHLKSRTLLFSDIGVEIDFLPVVFSQDNIFYELFSITVQLFNTTWHEMSAKSSDFNKVCVSLCDFNKVFVILTRFV